MNKLFLILGIGVLAALILILAVIDLHRAPTRWGTRSTSVSASASE